MRSMRRILCLLAILFGTGMHWGCGTLPNGRGWGQDATLRPGWKKVRVAALNVVTEPDVWIPAAAALILQIDDMDERLSDWAINHSPIFGSKENADKASDTLRDTALTGYLVTTMLTPSGGPEDEWTKAKMKGLGVGIAAMSLTVGTTTYLKGAVDRTRPDKSDQRSFPSGHPSYTASSLALASRNIRYLGLSNWEEKSLKTGFRLLSLATGWSRVEAARHYPSDVLAGMALGHFFGAFINDAFLGVDSPDGLRLQIGPSPGGATINFCISF
jgi:hypothetical protein